MFAFKADKFVLLVLCHVQISAVGCDDMKVFPNLHLFHPESRKVYYAFMQPQTSTNRNSCSKFKGFCCDFIGVTQT